MKIAINTTCGGFGVSIKGMLEIAKRKGLKVYPYIDDPDYPHFSHHYVKADVNSNPLIVSYSLKDAGDKTEGSMYKSGLLWEFRPSDYKNRTDPDVIATIESLGEEADGQFGKLKVVEIPDGFDYMISEYDGAESVYFGKQLGVIE